MRVLNFFLTEEGEGPNMTFKKVFRSKQFIAQWKDCGVNRTYESH